MCLDTSLRRVSDDLWKIYYAAYLLAVVLFLGSFDGGDAWRYISSKLSSHESLASLAGLYVLKLMQLRQR